MMRIKVVFAFILTLTAVCVAQSINPNQVKPGTFQNGTYTFPGNVNLPSPGPIGGTTPSTVNATTVTATSFVGPLTGNAATASAAASLASTPTLCTGGQVPTGISASGNAVGCFAITGSVTATAMQSALSGQVGCTTSGNVWSPVSNTCLSLTSGFIQIACIGTSADQTAIVAADIAGANIAIVSGSCLFSSNVTLNATYWFFGGKFGPASSVVVTMNVQPQAAPTQVFTGSGTITLNNTATVYPEWFGAMGNSGSYTDQVPFNAAVASLTSGTIVLTKTNYYGCGFAVNKSYIGVFSPNEPRGGTVIKCNSATANILTVGSSSGGTNCSGSSAPGGIGFWNKLEGFGVQRTTAPTSAGAHGIEFINTCLANTRNVESWESASDYYVSGSANGTLVNTIAVNLLTASAVTVNGFEMDGTYSSNDSMRLGPHDVMTGNSGASTSQGLYIHGRINDLFTYDFETSVVTTGVVMSGTSCSSTYCSDLHFIGTINDGFSTSGWSINNVTNSGTATVEIQGGWSSSGGSTSAFMDVEGSNGVIVTGHQITSSGAGIGLKVAGGSSGNSFSRILFFGFPTGGPMISDVSGVDNSYIGNTFYGKNGLATMANFAGTSKSIISNNTFYGTATTGVNLDSSTSGNTLSANIVDLTSITTSYTDAGVNAWGEIASGTASLGTSSIASGACASAVTVAVGASSLGPAARTTDNIQTTFNGDPTAVSGYSPLTTGMLTIVPYPTAGNINYKVCNNTATSITPGALTLNWRVQR